MQKTNSKLTFILLALSITFTLALAACVYDDAYTGWLSPLTSPVTAEKAPMVDQPAKLPVLICDWLECGWK